MSDHVTTAHRAGIDMSYRAPDLPAAVRRQLPRPHLPERPEWLELYWRSWSIAHDQVRQPSPESGLVPFCDAAFSDHIFQWDTCFMEHFLRYAPESFCAAGSLDNFYRKQHDDGFICREISSISGQDCWPKEHASATNPPLFADAEWQLYRVHGRPERLAEVFSPLVRYFDWLRLHRQAADGQGLWTSLLGSGMDNSPRAGLERGADGDHHDDNGHAWVCMVAQQALAGHRLATIASMIGEEKEAVRLRAEAERLGTYLHGELWHDGGFYSDRGPNGQISDIMTPAMCWPLLLPGAPAEHGAAIAERLSDERYFWRSHAIPSLSADHALYAPHGNYWRGSVWPPMVHLAARAMSAAGQRSVAVRIAENHLENLAAVLEKTGTLWENYAPETAAAGDISRPEFVGWTGCGSIALLLDAVLGFDVNAPSRRITWNINRQDEHGVRGLPLADDEIDLIYDPQKHAVDVTCGQPFELCVAPIVDPPGDETVFKLQAGRHRLDLDSLQLGQRA